ncbi:hypothetical protein C8R45DRAFT_1079142 [Mycena sanguinolenta]|nr:hypothetical protein C8R45DRAFT_1079142 [Mycena sanguinolenta]
MNFEYDPHTHLFQSVCFMWSQRNETHRYSLGMNRNRVGQPLRVFLGKVGLPLETGVENRIIFSQAQIQLLYIRKETTLGKEERNSSQLASTKAIVRIAREAPYCKLTPIARQEKNLENRLNCDYGWGTPYYEDFSTLIRAEVAEGWVAQTENDGHTYRRGRIVEPIFVDSNTSPSAEDNVLRGQYQAHSYGPETSWIIALDEGAELPGMHGWQDTGWTMEGREGRALRSRSHGFVSINDCGSLGAYRRTNMRNRYSKDDERCGASRGKLGKSLNRATQENNEEKEKQTQ